MPFGFDEDSPSEPGHNPLIDAKDDVLKWCDKFARHLEATAADKTSLAQLASRLDEIRSSLPQLRTNLHGLRDLQSALEDADQNLAQLWEPTASKKHLKRKLVRARLQDIALELDDALTYVLHGADLDQLARVEQEPDLDDVAQIVVPRSPTRPRIKHPQGTNIEGSRSLSTGTDETESHLSHDIFGSSQVASQGVLTGVTHLTVDELCDKIRATAALSNIPIGDLFRREMPTGFQHEFILIRSAGPSIWIRIDRAAKGYQRGQLRTTYPADDTARMGGEQNHKQMAGKSRLRAHVVFPRDPKGPSFLTLADLVTIMHNESQDYRLLSENCYFFTSVIQEVLTEHCGGRLVSGALGHKKLGKSVRRRILRRFGVDADVPLRGPDHHTPSSGQSPLSSSHGRWNIACLLPKLFKLVPGRVEAKV